MNPRESVKYFWSYANLKCCVGEIGKIEREIDREIETNNTNLECCSSGERFASHDDIFDCRGSKRSGRLYFCSGPYLILPTIEW